MQRYSRRHHRVAKKEAALSPAVSVTKLKTCWKKYAFMGAAIVIIGCVKFFFLGYLVGKKA